MPNPDPTPPRSSVALTAGTVEYVDTGGDGPVVVLLGGLMMDDTVWRKVLPALAGRHRCVIPLLPLGGHRVALRPDADVSMAGLGRLADELLAALDLDDVVLVGADHALAQVVAADHPQRVAALVLLPMEAFDNYPPGLPGRMAALATRIPGGLFLAVQQLRFGWFQRSAIGFGRMSKRPIPADVVRQWTTAARHDRGVRRDVSRYVRTTPRDELVHVADRLASFDRPALVVWATEDRVMPVEHGRRLAALLPRGRLVELADSGTLVMEDVPDRVVDEISAFVADVVAARRR